MQVYIVGGAVRDLLMGEMPKDQDFVVVGSSVEEMLSNGFKQVGADFPVFLHPETGDEYALARTERKTGVGYKGFEFSTDRVSICDDLERRDLTINAIAKSTKSDIIIDPLNGREDINNKVLRHANEKSFVEDPLRVLRLARFCARFPSFTVARETTKLCRDVVASGELLNLTPERIALEMEKALGSERPSRFFFFLQMIGALEQVFPEIHSLIGKTQPYEHHPEGDAFVHTMMVLDEATANTYDKVARFCALTHDLGKGRTPENILPHHYGHEERGVPIINDMCDRLKLSNEYRNNAVLIARYHTHIHNFHKLNPKTIVKMYEDLKMSQNPMVHAYLADVSMYDAHGRTSFYKNTKYPNALKAYNIFSDMHSVKARNICTEEELANVNIIKKKMYNARLVIAKRAKA